MSPLATLLVGLAALSPAIDPDLGILSKPHPPILDRL